MKCPESACYVVCFICLFDMFVYPCFCPCPCFIFVVHPSLFSCKQCYNRVVKNTSTQDCAKCIFLPWICLLVHVSNADAPTGKILKDPSELGDGSPLGPSRYWFWRQTKWGHSCCLKAYCSSRAETFLSTTSKLRKQHWNKKHMHILATQDLISFTRHDTRPMILCSKKRLKCYYSFLFVCHKESLRPNKWIFNRSVPCDTYAPLA